MKKLIPFPLIAFTAGCMAEAPPARVAAESESRLSAELAGREAGPTVSCVRSQDLGDNRSVGEGALIFEGRTRNVLYVNRPPAGCPELRHGMALKTRTITNRLCRGDIVEVFDPLTGFSRGACGLGDFTPYRRLR